MASLYYDRKAAHDKKAIHDALDTEVASEESRTCLVWQNLRVSGSPPSTKLSEWLEQKACDVAGASSVAPGNCEILEGLEGTLHGGEMLLVIGKPGSGCTTFLRTLAGRTDGLKIAADSSIAYRGTSQNQLEKRVLGKCIYMGEGDVHFPHMTVAQTLRVALKAGGQEHSFNTESAMRDMLGALRLSHITETKVGNDLVSGCSGGERKRVSIAEVLVSDSLVQSWDNPTRGLDSENASIFIKTLRQRCSASGSMAIVTLYQASETIVQAFDKVAVLHEGRQIFFGSSTQAKEYFQRLGFIRTPRVSTSEFLASLTDPIRLQDSQHFTAPSSTQLEELWRSSDVRKTLSKEFDSCAKAFPAFIGHKSQSKPAFRLSYPSQIHLCLTRTFQRLAKDYVPGVSALGGNLVLSIILGSMFYNMPTDTSSFYGRGTLLFFATLTNTFLGAFEGVQMWDHRPIVEKHRQHGFYRPSAEAAASMLADLPNKLVLTAMANVPFYFMANLRRTPAAFWTFYLFSFCGLLTGSALFRAIGAVSKTTSGSIAPGATFILLLVIYTGYVLPIPDMPPWFGWMRHVNPMRYILESLIINEFGDRSFRCSSFVPGSMKCAVMDTQDNSLIVSGSEYISRTFAYRDDHLWPNLGWVLLIMVVLSIMYLLAAEYLTMQYLDDFLVQEENPSLAKRCPDVEAPTLARSNQGSWSVPAHGSKSPGHDRSRGTFMWRDVSCSVQESSSSKQILRNCDGWLLPGTMTALMGASGAGKTTLLNILAERHAVGIVSGLSLIDARYQDHAFARTVGYTQQQDLHLPTTTVREAFEFSALLRQSASRSKLEKLGLVDDVIEALDLTALQDTVIGPLGRRGLNVEQRKRVTIGVELVARPDLLLFLDEPTSGLDSNTAWSICRLLRKLCDHGQSILCTIHQPSSTLLQMFDRLLLLQHGETIYFGEIGPDASILTGYFESRGARPCGPTENAAEWMLEVVDNQETRWSKHWLCSQEYRSLQSHLDSMQAHLSAHSPGLLDATPSGEFATGFFRQLRLVTGRNFRHDWRTPSYLAAKMLLTIGSGLVNGFSFFNSPLSIQGVQNQIFSIFLVFLLHSNLIQVILPQFLEQRALYEARERLSKTYSWKVFILASFLSEVPWQTLLAVIQFVTWYFPIGAYARQDALSQRNERAGLVFLTIWSFTVFSSTFSHLLGIITPDAATGINISASLWSLCLISCGVLVNPTVLPRFWIWMYRVSPITYFVNTMAAASLAGSDISCSSQEVVTITVTYGQDCETFLSDYVQKTGARLLNPLATEACKICPVGSTDGLLNTLGIAYSERWRDLAITLGYLVVNVLGAMLLYRVARIKKRSKGGLSHTAVSLGRHQAME